MGLKLITPPASEPISLAEAKTHLRVIDSDQDSLISALIKAARMNCENWTGRAFVDQTWDLYFDEFPTGDHLEIKIPKPPLIQIVAVAYNRASDGLETQVDPSDYYVDNISEPGWIIPAGDSSSSWPTPIDAINSVRIRFRAGYLNADSPADTFVPDDIKAAIKLMLGSLYEHRESQVVGTISSQLPFGVENLLRPYRVLLGMA
jgi:uncharacterized phiE125 gp8 family phage protein